MTQDGKRTNDATAEYLAGMKYQRQLDEAETEKLRAQLDHLLLYTNHTPMCPRFPYTDFYDRSAPCRCGYEDVVVSKPGKEGVS